MPFVSRKAKIKLTDSEFEQLKKISKSRTEKKQKIERANIILRYSNDETINSISKTMKIDRPKIERCVNKAIQFGIMNSLEDLPRAGRSKTITPEAEAWVLNLACMKPKELGFASEYWTSEALAKYIRNHCAEDGHECLTKFSKGTLSKTLTQSDIKPHKISYYLERRDPEFDVKMAKVLCVYKEVEMHIKDVENSDKKVFLSYDEKPGIQAIGNIACDLSPVPALYKGWKRDHEYKRHGTLSMLAAIDLVTGKVCGRVHDRHRSIEFVDFLNHIDKQYPEDLKIKIILDNHSAHISKETQQYLKTVPNRFEFVFTPKHGSWLNLIEIFFSKMTRCFLRGIRVDSKTELKNRILKFLHEINEMPTVFTWKWKMDETNV